MKDNIKSSAISGIVFGILIGVLIGCTNNLFLGITYGIIAGLVFGTLMLIMVNVLGKKTKMICNGLSNDKVIYEGAANYQLPLEAVGGWLLITDKELIFAPHSLNIQKNIINISLNQIMNVKAGKTPSTIQIETIHNVEKFVVHKRKTWIEKINSVIS